VVIILVIVGAIAFYFYLNSKLVRINALANYSGRPAAGAGQNWLLTGSDSRGGLTRTQENQLALGHDVSGARSDTIMVLHIPASGPPVLVSLPRDSYVPIPGYGYNKLNAAYSFGGPQLLAKTVQNVTGLYINHYMGIGVGGLDSVVNDVGGVRMCIPAPMVDPKAGLNLKAGCQTLNGAQALGYVRTRQFAFGDLQRQQDQRLLLKALLSKVTSTGTLINPFATIPAANGAVSSVDVDQGTQLYQLVQVAFALRSPETGMVPFGGFANEAVGSVVLWDHAKATELFSDLANDRAVPKSLLSSGSTGSAAG
jgi:LCP family protein required for cell wall assembly